MEVFLYLSVQGRGLAMIVTFTLDLQGIKTIQDAKRFCAALAEEMVQSDVNKENDIKTIHYIVPGEKIFR